MFYLSLSFFPSQTEDILVKLPLEDHSKGQVGCKTYKNYFTAGAHWFIIIFLILVNIAAQVNKETFFGMPSAWCLHIIYTLFMLSLLLICI